MYKPEQYLDIPRTDLLTWTFGNTNYDQDKPIYVDAHDESIQISYKQAKSYVRRLISGLHARGIRPGDSVCVHAFNNVYYSLIWLAIIGVGGRFVGSNPSYTRFELSHLFSISGTRLVLVELGLLENVIPAAEDRKIPLSNVMIWDAHGEEVPGNLESWDVLLEHGARDWITFEDERQSETTIAALLSTSGTTGLPKAAAVSHRAQITQNIAISHSNVKPYESVRLLCLPLFHAFAGPLAHMSPLRDGYTTYIMKRYDQDQFLEYTARYQVSETLVVTPIVQGLLALPQSRLGSLASLRYVGAGGAPLDGAHQHEFNERLHPDAIFAQIWGLTEIGWITTFKYPEKDAGSVGRLLPNTEAMIVDKDGKEISDEGESGEILIRGPAMMSEYLGASEATAKTLVDGWLHTGDIGYQKAGKWYIVDRAKELIKVRAFQVSPTEIEGCLLQHPRILDAAVIGVGYPDVQVEQPRAYIVTDSRASSTPLTDDEIHDHVGKHLSKYKQLSGGIRRIDAIPKSAAGKILKKFLREAAAQEATELESVKHVEQAIPVDKHYFEHVEHVETGTGDGKGPSNGIADGDGAKTSQLSTNSAFDGAKEDTEIKEISINGVVNGNKGSDDFHNSNGNKKRKHMPNGNDTDDNVSHKRKKSQGDGIDGCGDSAESGIRMSSRINGDGV